MNATAPCRSVYLCATWIRKMPDLRSRKTILSRSGNPSEVSFPRITVLSWLAGTVVTDRCVGSRLTCVVAPAAPAVAIAPVVAITAAAASDPARVNRDARMVLLQSGLNLRQVITPRERLGPAVRYSATTVFHPGCGAATGGGAEGLKMDSCEPNCRSAAPAASSTAPNAPTAR